jgi:hypothetical protein
MDYQGKDVLFQDDDVDVRRAGFCVLDPSSQYIFDRCHVSQSDPEIKGAPGENVRSKREESWSTAVCCLFIMVGSFRLVRRLFFSFTLIHVCPFSVYLS